MSIGPTGASFASSIAASDLAQRNSADVPNAQQASTSQSRTVDSTQKAEKAASIGDADESAKTSDRDADGRRAWERVGHPEDEADGEAELDGEATYDGDVKSDPTGIKGREIDLSG